ncbi:hypothetical protein ACEQPO_00525 [Bacillus sp. SL00103]
MEKTQYLYNAFAFFILVDNVEQVTLKMSSNNEPAVTFNRQQLEKSSLTPLKSTKTM